MRTALFCIAKDEDRYIEEWVNYHLKLGFDDIYIACDRWTPWIIGLERLEVHRLVIKIDPPVQVSAYGTFMNQFREKFDYIAFFDVDEFLVLKNHTNVKDFLAEKNCSVGINWALFGDSNLDDDGSMGVLKRFTMRQIGVNPHVKCIVRTGPDVEMNHPHCPNGEWLGSDGEMHAGPFCENGNSADAQLNHYFCKTKQEWQVKRDRGRPDVDEVRPDSDFERHNFNEIKDLRAKTFLYGEE